MTYAFVHFTTAGRIVAAKVPSSRCPQGVTEYAAYIGFTERLSNRLFRGTCAGTTGDILMACGPFEGAIEATQYATRVQNIADHITTIVELLAGQKNIG